MILRRFATKSNSEGNARHPHKESLRRAIRNGCSKRPCNAIEKIEKIPISTAANHLGAVNFAILMLTVRSPPTALLIIELMTMPKRIAGIVGLADPLFILAREGSGPQGATSWHVTLLDPRLRDKVDQQNRLVYAD
jgi:hypothetical protein